MYQFIYFNFLSGRYAYLFLATAAFILLVLALPPQITAQSPLQKAPEDYPFQSGYPVSPNEWLERSSPTIIDLNNDGVNELLIGDYTGRILAYSPSGQMLSGYPLQVGGPIYGHLAFADLNNNGDLEIVAGVGSANNGGLGHVYVFHPDGSLYWQRSTARFDSSRQSKISAVAVDDVDGNGNLEVAAGTNNNNSTGDFSHYVPNLYLWRYNGATVAGWPVEDSDDTAILGALAMGDLDGDGLNDVIVTRDYHRVFAYNGQGNDLPGWPRFTFVPEDGKWNIDPRIVHRFSAPTLADLNMDGKIEYIVAGYRRPPSAVTFYNNDLLVLQPDGSRLSGWETPAGGSGVLSDDYHPQQAPSVADLNQDGQFDIVLPTRDGWIRAYEADKSLLWAFDFAKGKLIYASEAVIGDVDDDGLPEIIFGVYDPALTNSRTVGLWILEHNGVPKSGMPLTVDQPGIYAAPSLGDLDGDGDIEIAAAARKGKIYVWDLPAAYNPANLPWPMARFNPRRTAFFESPRPSLSGSYKSALPVAVDAGHIITYTLNVVRSGAPLTATVRITDRIPSGLSYVAGSLTATSSGAATAAFAPEIRWQGHLSETDHVQISYAARAETTETCALSNEMIIDDGMGNTFTRQAVVIINPKRFYLPLIFRR